jgi:hypothetical protein
MIPDYLRKGGNDAKKGKRSGTGKEKEAEREAEKTSCQRPPWTAHGTSERDWEEKNWKGRAEGIPSRDTQDSGT